MRSKNLKNKFQQFTDDKDFDGDVEEENEIVDENINKIENRLCSKINFKKNYIDNKITQNNNSENHSKLNNNSLKIKINENIKENNFIHYNNSNISEKSIPKTTKSNSINMDFEININNEMKNKLDDKDNNKKNLSLIIEKSNYKLKQKNDLFDTSYNTTNNSQLDNSEFLLNKLKGNKLLQELKLKESMKNKFRYYEKEKINNNNDNITFNIIENKNDIKDKLTEEPKKKNNKSYLNKKLNRLYFNYLFNCEFKCYCHNLCKRNNRRFNVINFIRNLFIFIVIISSIGLYSIILFYNK